MRYGCCTNMLVNYPGGPGGSGIEYLDQIKEIGFDYIELMASQMSTMTESAFEQLARQIEASGIRCEALNNFSSPDMRLTGPNVANSAVTAHVTAALNRAHALGVEYVVFGSGPSKNVPEGFPRAEAYKQIVDLLARCNEIARKSDVTICIEPLRHQECNIINTYAEGCQLARDVNGSNVKVLIDYYHLATEREPAQHIIDGKKFLRHVHYSSIDRRSFPNKLDDELARDFFRALKTVGYNDRISLEAYISKDFVQEASLALQFLKDQVAVAEPFPVH